MDITYNMYNDSNGEDPDKSSKILNEYHHILWNKKLPNGKDWGLKKDSLGGYILVPSIDMESIKRFSSDLIIHTYRNWDIECEFSEVSKFAKEVKEEYPDAFEEFWHLAGTIGGYIIFPCNKLDGVRSINSSRGFDNKIKDRFDLTLECIRRWYEAKKDDNKEENPLYEVIDRYKEFFLLFSNFKEYVNFFFLQDLVSDDYSRINFWLPFDNFETIEPLPKNKDEYKEYMKNVTSFVKARNQRIDDWCNNK